MPRLPGFRRAPTSESPPYRRRRRGPSAARCRPPGSSAASGVPCSSSGRQRLRDLGGLMLEMYRRDQFRQDLLVDRCGELQQLEERLAELDALLAAAVSRGRTRARPRGASAAHPIFWGSKFCAQCGRPGRRSAAAAGRDAHERPRRPPRLLPPCGVAYEPLQEYCLECGDAPADEPGRRRRPRLDAGSGASRGIPATGSGRSLFFFVLTVVATAAVARRERGPVERRAADPRDATPGHGRPRHDRRTGARHARRARCRPLPPPTITTGPLPTAPGTAHRARPATTPTPNPNALAVWPAGKSGYTNVLESLPVDAGRADAVARARRAKRAGLAGGRRPRFVPVLEPPPGLLRRLLGDLRDPGRGERGLAAAHAKGFPDAYQTRVTR